MAHDKILWDQPKCLRMVAWRISPTLRCNLHCPYCTGEFVHRSDLKSVLDRKELTVDEWGAICDKLPPGPIIVTGGEPFCYTNLVDLLNRIKQRVLLWTNLVSTTDEQIEALNRSRLGVMATYHHGLTPKPFWKHIAQAKRLQDKGAVVKIIFLIRGPKHKLQFQGFVKRCEDTGLPYEFGRILNHCGSWPGCLMKGPGRRVLCKTTYLHLVGPEGVRFPCQSALIRNVRPMENLRTSPPGPSVYKFECPDFGHCLPCDKLACRMITTVPQSIGGCREH